MSTGRLLTDTAQNIESPFHSDEHPDFDTGEQFGIREMEVVSEGDDLFQDGMEVIDESGEEPPELEGSGQAPTAESNTTEVSGPQPGASPEEGSLTIESGDSRVDPVSTTPDAAAMAGDRSEETDAKDERRTESSERSAASDPEAAESREEPAAGESAAVEAARSGPVESSGNVVSAVVGALVLAALGVGWYLFTTYTGDGGSAQAAGAEAEVSLQVESRPEGATVRFDGREVGVTPMELSVPSDETIDLELRKRGFETKQFQNFDPAEQPGDRVFASLDRRIVELQVRSPFPRSEVSIDGESRGVLPAGRGRTFEVEWPTSELSVTIDPPNHEPLTRQFPASSVREEMQVQPAKSQFARDAPASETDVTN